MKQWQAHMLGWRYCRCVTEWAHWADSLCLQIVLGYVQDTKSIAAARQVCRAWHQASAAAPATIHIALPGNIAEMRSKLALVLQVRTCLLQLKGRKESAQKAHQQLLLTLQHPPARGNTCAGYRSGIYICVSHAKRLSLFGSPELRLPASQCTPNC